MNILKYTRNEIVALFKDGIVSGSVLHHWEICKALSEGKTIEKVAEDFRVHPRGVQWVKANKCPSCTT